MASTDTNGSSNAENSKDIEPLSPDLRDKLRLQIEDKDNLPVLIRLICLEYNLDPTLKTNITNIVSFLGPLRVDIIISRVRSLPEANQLIVKIYGDTIRPSIHDDIDATRNKLLKMINTTGNDATNLDTAYADSFRNRERFKESFSGVGSILDMSLSQRIDAIKYINYQSLFRDEYIVVDSRYQNKVNTDPTKMVFSLIGDTKTKSDHGGVIIGNTIKDIVEIEVYSFTIPYKPVYATFYNKITLTINEWAANSFEAYEGGQFHFCFDIEKIENNLIFLKPINSVYSFSKPVNHIDDFTISFGAVFPKISFDADRMYPSIIDYTNPYGLLTFSDPHGLVSGDLVYISGFDTMDPAKDVVIITEINRPEGHSIVKKDNYSFIINVDLSVLRREDPVGSGIYPIDSFQQQVIVYFASKRVQIQMRLRYLTSYA